MKIIAFNGSPHKEGNTYHALRTVLSELENDGHQTEIIHVGNKNIRGCTACNMCMKNRDNKCVIKDEYVNGWIQKAVEADGILLGSPVHFASLGSTFKSFLDRMFYVSSSNGSLFRHKLGAAVVVVRRSGGLPTFNELNNYLNYSEMLIPTSNYWNVAHGTKPGEVLQDEEGMQILRILGKNAAYLLKLMDNNIEKPEKEKKIYTNFIR